MREAEFRGRVKDGAWTDWTESANGDPVWFGGMDELQIRTHGWRPEGRVHYVSVPETSPQVSERARAGGMPNVISRRQWGANKKRGGCKPSQDAEYGKVKAASVHHTVSATNYSESEAAGLILGICRFHRNSNGWNDVGYNAFVDRFGNIYEGRAGGLSRAVIGAQAQGVNAQTTGVALLGTHTSTPISDQARKGLVKWLTWKLPEHGLDGTGKARMVSAGGETARYPQGERIQDAPDHRPPRHEPDRVPRRRPGRPAVRHPQADHPQDRRRTAERRRRDRLAGSLRGLPGLCWAAADAVEEAGGDRGGDRHVVGGDAERKRRN